MPPGGVTTGQASASSAWGTPQDGSATPVCQAILETRCRESANVSDTKIQSVPVAGANSLWQKFEGVNCQYLNKFLLKNVHPARHFFAPARWKKFTQQHSECKILTQLPQLYNFFLRKRQKICPLPQGGVTCDRDRLHFLHILVFDLLHLCFTLQPATAIVTGLLETVATPRQDSASARPSTSAGPAHNARYNRSLICAPEHWT